MDSMRATIQLAPRNQTYLLNMAQIYMAGKNWDAATALLERLKTSPDPQIAKSATEQLEGLPMLKKYGVLPQAGTASASTSTPASSSSPSTSSAAPSSISKTPATTQAKAQPQNPQPENPQADEVSVDHPEQPPAPPQPDKRPIQFLKGKIVSIDCSHAPSAILTVSGGAKVLKLRTDNYKSLMVMGADDFSCEWKGRAVAVNYRAGGTSDGDLVSVELE
jgi:cytoskeletal protein RodZ